MINLSLNHMLLWVYFRGIWQLYMWLIFLFVKFLLFVSSRCNIALPLSYVWQNEWVVIHCSASGFSSVIQYRSIYYNILELIKSVTDGMNVLYFASPVWNTVLWFTFPYQQCTLLLYLCNVYCISNFFILKQCTERKHSFLNALMFNQCLDIYICNLQDMHL